MRTSLTRMSSSQLPTKGPSGSALLQRTAATLLPPIPLYRRLLRAHRNVLSYEMRSLGDNYLKDEFKRHKKVDNPLQIVGFLGQWKLYLDQMEGGSSTEGEKKIFEGKKLDAEQFEKLSEEQTYQLHEFMTATKELYNPSAPGPPDAPQSADAGQATGSEGEGDRIIKDILDSSSRDQKKS
ncbi:unnamed protein product [Sympodiomycopsis kandeliae]